MGIEGFDGKWFDDLAKITEKEVDGARGLGISENVPYLEEMYAYNLVPSDFYFTCLELLRRLSKTKYRMSPHIRVAAQHIYVFPQGKAYRWQPNIGFWAGESHMARIGVGFDIRSTIEKSVDDYLKFRDRATNNGKAFDQVFQALGPYSEPDHIFRNQPSLAKAVLADKNWVDDWRFYGRCLRLNAPEERIVLDSMDLFVNEVVRVLGMIEQAGFLG